MLGIQIEIRGPGVGVNLPVLIGLTLGIGSDGSVIRGLCINSFGNIDTSGELLTGGTAIEIESDNNSIEGNFIGTDVTGNIPLINLNGTYILGNNNTIGGATNQARNLYIGSYNPSDVIFASTAGLVVITGNTIGLAAHGKHAPTTDSNVGILAIGGPLTVTNNIIAGHTLSNISLELLLEPLGPINISNNLIGTDVTGNFNAGNNGQGIAVYSFETSQVTFPFLIIQYRAIQPACL